MSLLDGADATGGVPAVKSGGEKDVDPNLVGSSSDNDAGGEGDGGSDKGGATDGDGGDMAVTHDSLDEDLKNPDVLKDGLYFGKYKTLSEAAKAVAGLTDNLRNPRSRAPEAYDFSDFKLEGFDGVQVDTNDELYQAVDPVAKEIGLSQKDMNKLVSVALPIILGREIDPKKEIEALGEGAQKMINSVHASVQDAPKEILDDIHEITSTAAGVRALSWALQGRVSQIPSRTSPIPQESAAELRDKARSYKEKHAATIEGNREQQKTYDDLMTRWAQADERERGSKK